MADTKPNGIYKIATIEIPELTTPKCPKEEIKTDAEKTKTDQGNILINIFLTLCVECRYP